MGKRKRKQYNKHVSGVYGIQELGGMKMIATKTEIKALLAITSTTNDALIDRLIPIIEDDIREYCNNGFRNDLINFESAEFSFTRNSTSVDTITYEGTGRGFLDLQFKDGQTVQVQGSYNNDGFHEVESVSSATLTMYSTTSRPYFQEMVTEDETDDMQVGMQITQVLYPKALKNAMAQMVNYKLTNHDYMVKSETVARYSVTYADSGSNYGGYPQNLMTGLNKWKQVRFV